MIMNTGYRSVMFAQACILKIKQVGFENPLVNSHFQHVQYLQHKNLKCTSIQQLHV